jgi:hypothetical protein
MKGEALERPAPSGAAAGEGFNLLGDALAPTERKLCSQAARRDMALFIDEIRDGEIVIREAEWKRKATSAQVGLASWLSHCTQDGRPLRIIGDESRAILALWDPGRGYVPVAEPR